MSTIVCNSSHFYAFCTKVQRCFLRFARSIPITQPGARIDKPAAPAFCRRGLIFFLLWSLYRRGAVLSEKNLGKIT